MLGCDGKVWQYGNRKSMLWCYHRVNCCYNSPTDTSQKWANGLSNCLRDYNVPVFPAENWNRLPCKPEVSHFPEKQSRLKRTIKRDKQTRVTNCYPTLYLDFEHSAQDVATCLDECYQYKRKTEQSGKQRTGMWRYVNTPVHRKAKRQH